MKLGHLEHLLKVYSKAPAVPVAPALENFIVKPYSRRITHLPYMPTSVYLGVTTRCNLSCVMCNVRSLKYVSDLSYADFRFILRQLPAHTMRRVTCLGPGEPLLNQDLPRMMACAKHKGFITHMFTNGTLLSQHNVNELLRVLDEITLSMDGATKETYERIRQGASFREVVDNVRALTTARRKTRAHTKIVINFVCSKLNFHEITKMVSLAYRWGIHHLNVSEMREMFPWKDCNKYSGRVKRLQVETAPRRVLAEACRLASRLRIDFSYQVFTLTFARCLWPFRGCFITQDGFVTPCCLIPDPDVINFGNIFDRPLREIWNSRAYVRFRQRFIKHQPLPVCARCVT